MLEKPDVKDEAIIDRLGQEFGVEVARLDFLPIGADVNTAVYRAEAGDGTAFFLKLRRGDFDAITVDVPLFLKEQGIREIIAPLETRAGQLWASLEPYKMILYPFVEGQDGYALALTDAQWMEFGAALKAVHSAAVPEELARRVPKEIFSPRWREVVRSFQAQVEEGSYTEPVAVKMAAYMRDRREEIQRLVERAEVLANALRERQLEMVLCHTDIHPGNLLISPNGAFYIVDWDAPMLAPKEHDLTLIGGGATWSSARETALFYQGYRQANVDRMALAYYRCERIIMDIAEFCEQILATDAGGEDREQGYRWFISNFLPGHEIELANRTRINAENADEDFYI